MNFDLDFYKGKKVFVTGHTGFKGSWLCKMLANAGAMLVRLYIEELISESILKLK